VLSLALTVEDHESLTCLMIAPPTAPPNTARIVVPIFISRPPVRQFSCRSRIITGQINDFTTDDLVFAFFEPSNVLTV
jgi:hypothetical protein